MAVDLITNKRTITTNVLVEDGGILVLGGLISDELRESKAQVPFLGAIPLLGELFKTRSVDKVKTNLMVFIRPRIIRDGTDAAIETNAKYNYLREQQLNRNNGKVPLMPTERQPTLPALEDLVSPEYLNPVAAACGPGGCASDRARADRPSRRRHRSARPARRRPRQARSREHGGDRRSHSRRGRTGRRADAPAAFHVRENARRAGPGTLG